MKVQTEILQLLKAAAVNPPTPAQPSNTGANVDSSDSDSEGETEEWKAGFGDELWKNVKGKRT